MQKPKWVVFDVGGVLLNWHDAAASVSDSIGISIETLFTALSRKLPDAETGQLTNMQIIGLVIKELGIDMEPEVMIGYWIKSVTVYKKTWKLVSRLKDNGYLLGICTNNWNPVLEIFKSKGLGGFDKIIESWKEGVRKPDREMYQRCEELLNEKGKNIFFIDDLQENIDAANDFGWQTFLFELGDDEGKAACGQLRQILL